MNRPPWLRPALYASWTAFSIASVMVAATCFAYVFLPESAHYVNVLGLLMLGAIVRILMVALGTLHHQMALSYQQPIAAMQHKTAERALFHIRWALRWTPGDLRLYTLWCQVLRDIKRYEDVEQVIENIRRLELSLDEIDTQKAYLALAQGKYKAACKSFDRAYRLRRGIAWNDVPERIPADQPELAPPKTIKTTQVKLQHDLAQLRFLLGGDYLPPAFKALIQNYEALLKTQAQRTQKERFIQLNASESASISLFYGRNVHISPVPAFPRDTLHPDWQAETVERAYAEKTPSYVVVDAFLQPDTAEALLHFCQKSTIWHDDTRPGGYLGAYMDDGFNCDLLYQIAEELGERLPQIFQGLVLRHMWAYTYASRKEGIGIHADNAAVNVNFWITPDDANLNPEGGGMILYDQKAPEHWRFDTYNKNTAKIEAFLQETQASARTIPYRHNRAVIFDGRLFHATDDFVFADAYLKKRINITLLFDRL